MHTIEGKLFAAAVIRALPLRCFSDGYAYSVPYFDLVLLPWIVSFNFGVRDLQLISLINVSNEQDSRRQVEEPLAEQSCRWPLSGLSATRLCDIDISTRAAATRKCDKVSRPLSSLNSGICTLLDLVRRLVLGTVRSTYACLQYLEFLIRVGLGFQTSNQHRSICLIRTVLAVSPEVVS